MALLKSDAISIMSHVSFDPVSSPSRPPNADALSQMSHDINTTATALSFFILETCSRQLQQYHLSTLNEEVVNHNIGEGLDYSVDITQTSDGELVAVKHRKIEAEEESEAINRRSAECERICKALREIRIMTHPSVAQCEHILSLKGFGWEFVGGKETTPSIVVEFAHRGNLRQYLTAEPHQSDSEKWRLLAGVREGLLVLHSCGIIHGDIKMENVLVAGSPGDMAVPKIADFGSSVITTSEDERHSYWGTDVYNAPEIRISGSSGYKAPRLQLLRCDAWAFGLLALETALDGQCYIDQEISQCVSNPLMPKFEESCLRRLDEARLSGVTIKTQFNITIAATLKRSPEDRVMDDTIGIHSGCSSNQPM